MEPKITQLAAALALALTAAKVHAAIIATENFDYPNGPLVGDNGGTGWTTAWTGVQGTPTVSGGQAIINSASGQQAERSLPAQGAGSVVWILFSARQFTTAAAGVTNDTYGGFWFYYGTTQLGGIGKSWPGPYRWSLAYLSTGPVGIQTTLASSVIYSEVTTTGYGMTVNTWINPTNPAIIAMLNPDLTYTFSGTGWDTIMLRGGTDGSVASESWSFTNIIIANNPTNIGVLPPPPPPQLSNSQINVTFNGDGSIYSMALFQSNAWENVSFNGDGSEAGPQWRMSDSSGTRTDPLTLAYPAKAALTNLDYTNLVFTGSDSANPSLQLALAYQLSSNQLEIVASITNAGATTWSPIQGGILMGIDTYMASYPSWDYLYFPTLLRCEKTHFWGYAMTPLGSILGIVSPDPVASWHNEYEPGGHRIYTFGLDFLNELPLPARHPQNLTSLRPGQGMSWTVFIGDIPDTDSVSMDEVLPALAGMADAPMIKASRYTGEPGDTVNFTFWGNPVGGSFQTPDGVMHPLALAASSNGMATASLTLPATNGLCNLLVTNVAGRIAQGSVYVRQPWSWYLKQARINAIDKPQKDAGAQCEGYYGFYSEFLAKRWFPDPVLDPLSESKFSEIYPLMFSITNGLSISNPGRLQNDSTMAGILVDRFNADGGFTNQSTLTNLLFARNITNLVFAAALCDYLLGAQESDGGYYNGGDYTSVIYPAKSIMEVMALEQVLAQTNAYWHTEYTNHYRSVTAAMNHLALNLDNIGTEGEQTFEDGMISCSGAQLGMYALYETNTTLGALFGEQNQQYYIHAAEWFESAHRCLDQILVPDAQHNGGTERFWEDQYDIITTPNFLCSPHGWSAWNIYGRWYLYQMTGNVEYLRQAMNALGACTQLIAPVSESSGMDFSTSFGITTNLPTETAGGNLNWAYCTDPFIQATIFTNNPANTDPDTQGAYVSGTIGEQSLPMISGWCLAPYGTAVSMYSGYDGGCNDNDVHEIFKCLEEVALTSAYVVINADGSIETWNCQAVQTNGVVVVTPSEDIVNRVNVNAPDGANVCVEFSNGAFEIYHLTGMGWISPAAGPVTLTAASTAPGRFNLQFQGLTGTAYVIETSTNLVNWTSILTNLLTTNPFVYETNATNPARFYRIGQ